MADIRTIGVTEAVRRLRLCGFTFSEAEALVAMKLRLESGECKEAKPNDRREFARYLVENGWLNDWGETRHVHDDRPLPDLLREIEELIARRRPIDDHAGPHP